MRLDKLRARARTRAAQIVNPFDDPSIWLAHNLPGLHAAQEQIRREARRFNVVNCGRRWGKDVLGVNRLIEPALRGLPVGWFAPKYQYMLDNWRDVERSLASLVTGSNKAEHRITLMTGGHIDMWSLDDPDSGRGRKYARVIINEAAKVKDLLYSWNYVIRQTLADLRGDAWFLSTPRGLNGFYTLYQTAAEDEEWRRWRMPTYANPFIDAAEVDELRRMLPEATYRQEIEAEFIEDGAYFQNVPACAIIDAPDTPDAHIGHTLLAGVDWGKSHDWTVISIACRQCGRVVDWARFNRIDYHYQRERLLDLATRWQVAGVLPERNRIGEANIEELMRENLPIMRGPDGRFGFNTTATTKADIIEALHLALARGEFLVPREFSVELQAYEIEIGGALPRFGAPVGQHDDCVIALALTWYALSTARPLITGW